MPTSSVSYSQHYLPLETLGSAILRRIRRAESKVLLTYANANQVITAVDSETTAKLKYSFDKGFTKMEYKVTVSDGL